MASLAYSPVKSQSRLMVVDEAIAMGGIERVVLALLPELSRRVERVVWVLPNHRLEGLGGRLADVPGLELESFSWPRWSWGDLVSKTLKRLPKAVRGAGSIKACERWLEDQRLRSIGRRQQVSHVLYPALFRQRFPRIGLPVWAVVHDVNYHPSWSQECFKTLEAWMRKADGIIAGSKFTETEIRQLYPTLMGRLAGIPHASEMASDFIPAGDQVGSRPKESKFCLYYPASFNPHKGHALLLESFRLLLVEGFQVKLVLTGGGLEMLSSKMALENTALEAARLIYQGGNAEFQRSIDVKGLVTTEEVETCFVEADIVVLPSS